MKIAIIGGGVAGVCSAYLLDKHHEVTLFEANSYIGGHTNTITVPHEKEQINVDTGFIVFNTKNYPLFCRFLDQLGVPSQESDMSFGFYDNTQPFYYSSRGVSGLFAQKKQWISPSFYTLIADIYRYNRVAIEALSTHNLAQKTVKDFIIEHQFSSEFTNYYLLPMGAAIWSCSYGDILKFPLRYFLQFWHNHSMLTTGKRPTWRTVSGGSATYIRAFLDTFSGTIKSSTPIHRIERHPNSVTLYDNDNNVYKFDAVVIAAHADQVLPLLANASLKEKQLFSAWRYSNNDTVLHTDTSILPPSQNAWASWNYHFTVQNPEKVGVTYHMNRLQQLTTDQEYLVSLNYTDHIRPDSIIKHITYHHPVYTFESIETQESIKRLSGNHNTYFCGSYLGYGFHEDAVRSAVDVAQQFGISL